MEMKYRLKKDYASPQKTLSAGSVDGKPLYDGDDFWYIDLMRVETKSRWCSAASVGQQLTQDRYKVFSSKEAADAWILENRKPLIVTVEGVVLYDGDSCWRFFGSNPHPKQFILGPETIQHKGELYFADYKTALAHREENELKWTTAQMRECWHAKALYGKSFDDYLKSLK